MNKNMSKISQYFTKEIMDQVNAISHQDMNSLLLELEGTPLWFAIIKYNQMRISNVESSFLVLDPLKEASKISKYQGVVTGVLDLQDAVLTLKFGEEAAEDPRNAEEDAKNDLGGAYGQI